VPLRHAKSGAQLAHHPPRHGENRAVKHPVRDESLTLAGRRGQGGREQLRKKYSITDILISATE